MSQDDTVASFSMGSASFVGCFCIEAVAGINKVQFSDQQLRIETHALDLRDRLALILCCNSPNVPNSAIVDKVLPRTSQTLVLGGEPWPAIANEFQIRLLRTQAAHVLGCVLSWAKFETDRTLLVAQLHELLRPLHHVAWFWRMWPIHTEDTGSTFPQKTGHLHELPHSSDSSCCSIVPKRDVCCSNAVWRRAALLGLDLMQIVIDIVTWVMVSE